MHFYRIGKILSTCTQPELMLKNDFSLKDIIYHLEEILGFGIFIKMH